MDTDFKLSDGYNSYGLYLNSTKEPLLYGEEQFGAGSKTWLVFDRGRRSTIITEMKEAPAPTQTPADLQSSQNPTELFIARIQDRFVPSSSSSTPLSSCTFSNSSASSCGTLSSLSSDGFHSSAIASMPHSPVATSRAEKAREVHKTTTNRTITYSEGWAESKIFGCTWRGCYERFRSKYEWKRHEETIHCLQGAWTCPVAIPPTRRKPGRIVCGREFRREVTFRAHLRNTKSGHGYGKLTADKLAKEYRQLIFSTILFRKDCGFCGESLPTWEYRIDHIADEYTKNGMDISMWKDPWLQRNEVGSRYNDGDVKDEGNDVNMEIIQRYEDMETKTEDMKDENLNFSCERVPSPPNSAHLSPAAGFPIKVGSTLGKASPYSVQSQDDGSDFSFENEIELSDDDCDSVSSSCQSSLKLYLGGPAQRLVVEILGAFWELYNKEWPSIVSHCIVLVAAAGETSGSNYNTGGSSRSVPSASAGSKSSTSINASAKRKRSEDEPPAEGGGDGRSPPEVETAPMSKLNVSYACPFRKHDPRKYNIYGHMSCALGSFGSIARVKEHLYRRHMAPTQCVRCWLFFKNQDELNIHLSATNICERRDGQLVEGITATMEKRLRSRKKTFGERTDQDRWRNIYRMLFPDEEVPSPLYDPVQDDGTQPSESPDISIEEFMRQMVPENFTNRLQSEVNNWDLEETGLQDNPARLRETFITRITSLIREAQDAAIQSYRQRYSRGSSQSNQLMTPVPAANSWNFTNGQLTPASSRSHYRESSLSSLGSAGPASPYTSWTSHPQVILPSDSEMSSYESIATPAMGDECDGQHRKTDFRSTSSIPKLDRTMSDAYNDELYNPNLVFMSAPSANPTDGKTLSHPHSDVFSQRLQAANNQHLSTLATPKLGQTISATFGAPWPVSRHLSHEPGCQIMHLLSQSQCSQSSHTTVPQSSPNIDQADPYNTTKQTASNLHSDGNSSISPDLLDKITKNRGGSTFDSQQEQGAVTDLSSGIQTFGGQPFPEDNDSPLPWYPGYNLTPWLDTDDQANPPT